MNYEKRYKEALERAKDNYKAADSADINVNSFKNTLTALFPELKESEDEKMRKSVIYALRNGGFYDNDKTDEAIAWLEKQGEQKSADKVEPKFKVGDWVFIEWAKWYKKGLFQIKDVDCFGYSFDKYYTIPFMYEDVLSKWTIEDAKDGDVLCSLFHHLIWIYKDSGQYYACVNMNYTTENINTNGLINIPNDVRPATKDEQIILFEKMKEAGYEWDANKKELIKL